jgi:creatinine amidohydrolase
MKKYLWQEMTWEELQSAAKECDIALLPTGSCEQHGPMMPLGTDFYIAYEAAKRVAERTGTIVAPPLPVGMSGYHLGEPGTISVKPLIMIEYFADVLISISNSGFNKVIVLNGHAGQQWLLSQASLMANAATGVFVAIAHWWELACEEVRRECGRIWHADEAETSVALALLPDGLVDMGKAGEEAFPEPTVQFCDYDLLPELKDKFLWSSILPAYPPEKDIRRTGMYGDVRKASREKGERIVSAWIDNLVKFIEDLKRRYPVGVKVGQLGKR